MKKSILLWFLGSLLGNLYAQGEKDWWAFGNGNSMHLFHNGVVPSMSPCAFQGGEASSIISDPVGNLLFYTDGRTVWNRLHQPMPNGTGLLGGPTGSSTMGALIVPQPLNKYTYYVFTVDEGDNGMANGLRYSVVDIQLNGGLGDVLPGSKNILIKQDVCEKVCAVANADGTAYWILTHEFPGNAFYAYALTPAGLNPFPVISVAGYTLNYSTWPPYTYETVGNMRISPSLTKLVAAHTYSPNSIGGDGVVEIFNFDNNTGIVSNVVSFSNGQMDRPYGVSFSDDGRYAYIADVFHLWQIDLLAPNPLLALFPLHYNPNVSYRNILLGVDKKIYVIDPITFSPHLHVINYPQNWGGAASYQQNYVLLLGGVGGLPNFPEGLFSNKLGHFRLCPGEPLWLWGYNAAGAASCLWSGPAGFSSTRMRDTLTAVGAQHAGSYYYSLLDSAGAVIWRDTLELEVLPTYADTLVQYLCAGDSLALPWGGYAAQPGPYTHAYASVSGCDSLLTVWLVPDGPHAQTLTATACAGQPHTLPDGSTANASGTYPVTLQSIHGCDSLITTTLTVYPVFSQNLSASLCAGQTYTLPDGSTVGASGTYPVTLQSVHGCDSLITTTLTVYPVFSQNLSASLCAGQTYTLPDGSTANTSGIYPVTLQSIYGCDSLITTTLTVYPVFSQNLSASLCAGQTYILPDGSSANTSGTYPVTLQSLHGCDSLITTNLTVYPVYSQSVSVSLCRGQSHSLPDGSTANTSGVYPVTLQSVHGCDSLTTTTLTVHPAYADSLRADICAGEVYTLPGGGNTGTAGLYPFAYTTAAGCDSLLEVRLYVHPLPEVALGGDRALCEGQPLTLSVPSGQGSYLWNTGAQTPSLTVAQAGTYSLSVTSPQGCTASDSMRVTAVYPPPSGFLPPDSSLCETEELRVEVPGFVSYLWEDGTDLPVRTLREAGIYTLTVRDPHGCRGTDSLRVSDHCPMQLYIPTAFTPNGDGENDFFRAYGTNILSFELTLYDRWGKVLYRLGSLDESWDGAGAPEGVYTYRCMATGTRGRKLEKGGTVTLMR